MFNILINIPFLLDKNIIAKCVFFVGKWNNSYSVFSIKDTSLEVAPFVLISSFTFRIA